jgi:hypothetical protein
LDATEVRALHSQAHYIRHSTALAAPLLQMLQRSQLQVKSGLQQRGQQGQQQQEEQEEEGVEGVSILATQQDRIEQEQLLQKWVQDWEQQEGRLVAQLVPKLCQAGHDPPKANWLAHQAVADRCPFDLDGYHHLRALEEFFQVKWPHWLEEDVYCKFASSPEREKSLWKTHGMTTHALVSNDTGEMRLGPAVWPAWLLLCQVICAVGSFAGKHRAAWQ